MNALAQALLDARRQGRALAAADWGHELSRIEQAYEVQEAVAAGLGGPEPHRPLYWKSGGPSRSETLTHAPLPPQGARRSPADFSGWHFHAPRIEAEIALRLGREVGPQEAARLGQDDIDALIDAMAVSIEVVDSRWQEGGSAPALLRLADLQSHGALVLGDWMPYRRRDWSIQSCEVRIGAQAAVRRTGTHSLGDPAWLLPAWLQHATRKGERVQAGTVVTTGTWVGVLPARAGDAVEVHFEGLGRAAVQL